MHEPITARKSRNLTQQQLAERMGVTRSAVSQWESETTGITIDRLVRICDALGYILDINLTPAER